MDNKNYYVSIASLFSALGGLLFGYDTGVISGAILFIRKDFSLNDNEIELVISAVLLGCVLGSPLAGALADKFGRRKLLLFAAALFTVASLLTALAPSALWLGIGRVFIGFAIGFSSIITPLYIAEIAPPSIRGRLVTLNQLAITVGIVVSYLVGYLYSSSGNWSMMLGLAAVPSIIFGVGMWYLPESPRWLYNHGKKEEALIILTKVHGEKTAKEEIQEIEMSIEESKTKKPWQMTPWLKRALMIGICLAVFQQLTGINTVIYYAPMIFEFAGYNTPSVAILATGIIGIVNVLATIVSLWLIDKVGRRKLLLTGLFGMILSLLSLGFSFHYMEMTSHLGWLTLISLMVYVASFAISLGPVFWLLVSEIYPTSIRGKAMSIATFFNWASNLLVALTFLTLINYLGRPGTFWFYAAIGVVAWVFSYFLVPETKNKTLEQIEKG